METWTYNVMFSYSYLYKYICAGILLRLCLYCFEFIIQCDGWICWYVQICVWKNDLTWIALLLSWICLMQAVSLNGTKLTVHFTFLRITQCSPCLHATSAASHLRLFLYLSLHVQRCMFTFFPDYFPHYSVLIRAIITPCKYHSFSFSVSFTQKRKPTAVRDPKNTSTIEHVVLKLFKVTKKLQASFPKISIFMFVH